MVNLLGQSFLRYRATLCNTLAQCDMQMKFVCYVEMIIPLGL